MKHELEMAMGQKIRTVVKEPELPVTVQNILTLEQRSHLCTDPVTGNVLAWEQVFEGICIGMCT